MSKRLLSALATLLFLIGTTEWAAFWLVPGSASDTTVLLLAALTASTFIGAFASLFLQAKAEAGTWVILTLLALVVPLVNKHTY